MAFGDIMIGWLHWLLDLSFGIGLQPFALVESAVSLINDLFLNTRQTFSYPMTYNDIS